MTLPAGYALSFCDHCHQLLPVRRTVNRMGARWLCDADAARYTGVTVQREQLAHPDPHRGPIDAGHADAPAGGTT